MFEFEWDKANLSHIAEHGVLRTEAEEIFLYPTLSVDTEAVGDEVRFVELGRTGNGRILRIVTTERAGRIRVVTAFPASAVDRRLFFEQIGGGE